MSMLLLPKETAGGNFELPPAGNHLAVLWRIVDLGTQKVEYKDETKFQRKIVLSWEIHCESRMEDGRPYTFSKRYTYSSNEKSNLRKDLEAWRGVPFKQEDFESFDLAKLIGKPCLLNILHADRGNGVYADMASISTLIKGMPAPSLENEGYCFSLSHYDPVVYGKLSQRLQDIIALSPEFAEATKAMQENVSIATPGISQELDDEIPF